MAKVIAKLHVNGNFETVGVQLVQGGNAYSFTENVITVPTIIEYPPFGYRNYFIEKTSVLGYIKDGEGLKEPYEHDRTSDFIPVTNWGNGVMRVRFKDMSGTYPAWVTIVFYNASKEYVSTFYKDYVSQEAPTGNLDVEITFPVNVAFIRISSNYYDHSTASVKISVEKGTVATQKHYLAFEDMPEWVRDTGQPISIFPQGMVIKGGLIQTSG